jgi:hypothetical protein
MKKIINLGFSTAILLSVLASSCLLVTARENKLPKVGFVESSERGEGCYYSFAQEKRKQKYIFVNASGTLMNFDGQDTNLVRISDKSEKWVNVSDYTANNLKIRVTTISNNKYELKGTITIKNETSSKVIKFRGSC